MIEIMFVIQCSSLQHHAGYKPSELKECVLIIHDLQLSKRGSALVAVREKYKQHKVYIALTILFLLIQMVLWSNGLSDSS